MSFVQSYTLSRLNAETQGVVSTDARAWPTRFKDFVHAQWKEWQARAQRKYNPLNHTIEQFTKQSLDSPTSKCLIVFIHGLNSSPLAWSNYLRALPKDDPETSILVPSLYKKGYCKIEKAANPILQHVQNYAMQHPKNPIFLVGHSWGAVVGAYVQRNSQVKHISLVSIAGPHGGSKFMNWIEGCCLTKCFGITKNMAKKLIYSNGLPPEELQSWQQMKRKWTKNENLFFASLNDWRIYPIETCFPRLPNSKYFVLRGESHVTIIDAVKDTVIGYLRDASLH